MKKIDLPTYALTLAHEASNDLASLLPETDICIELRDILIKQWTILSAIVEDEYLVKSELDQFIIQCKETTKNVAAIKGVIGEGTSAESESSMEEGFIDEEGYGG